VIGLQAVPLTAGTIIDQIRSKNACVQIVAGKHDVSWSIVFNPAHFSDPSRTVAHAYELQRKRLRRDAVIPRAVGFACTDAGTVARTRIGRRGVLPGRCRPALTPFRGCGASCYTPHRSAA
jgi:hypothetical protein